MVKNQLTGDYGPVPDTARYYKVMALSITETRYTLRHFTCKAVGYGL